MVDSGFAAMDDGEILETEFQVPGDIGKQYAKVTGDFNPIHVSRLGARLFGFPRPIAHGMWSVAKTFELIEHTGFPIEHTAIFKGPMFVGSTAKLVSSKDGRFDVMCGRNPRPVIVGKCHT